MVHISNLRDKLETVINGEKFIHTVWELAIKLRNEAFDILKDIPKWKLIFGFY